jgi:hypothetical protein
VAAPPHIAQSVGSKPIGPGLRLGNGEACVGAKFHSPSPLILRETELVPWDLKISATALLCGTCADNLLVLQHLLGEFEGDVPWETRREFGNQLRDLGLRGWDIYAGKVKGRD